MRTLEQFLPPVRDTRRSFSFPSPLKTPFGYAFLILSLVLFLTLAYTSVDRKLKNLNAFYIDTAEQIEQVKQSSLAVKNDIYITLQKLGFFQENIDIVMGDIDALGEFPQPVTAADIQKQAQEQLVKWHEAQELIKNSLFYKIDIKKLNIKSSDESNNEELKEFLDAVKVAKPLPKLSEQLEAGKPQALAKLTEANKLKTEYKKIQKVFADELAKNEAIENKKQAKAQEIEAQRLARQAQIEAEKNAATTAQPSPIEQSQASEQPASTPKSAAPAKTRQPVKPAPVQPAPTPSKTTSDVPVW